MSDIERRLRLLGEQARQEVAGMSGPRHIDLRRIRVRRATLGTVAATCVVALSVVAVSLDRGIDDRPDFKPAASSTMTLRPDRVGTGRKDSPVWPEGSYAEARASCRREVDGPDRTRPRRLASDFARVVMGWDANATHMRGPTHRGTLVPVTRLTVDRGAVVEVYLHRAAPECWVVTGVSRPNKGRFLTGPSFSFEERVASAGFDPQGAVSATIEVTFGRRTAKVSWHGGPGRVQWRVPAGAPRAQRFLILFERADGEVIGAEAGGLRPGDFLD